MQISMKLFGFQEATGVPKGQVAYAVALKYLEYAQ